MALSEYAKRDLTVSYGGRTFAVRADRDDTIAVGPQWRSLIIEDRTPRPSEPRLATDPASCLAEAVRQVVAAVEASAGEHGPQPDRMPPAALNSSPTAQEQLDGPAYSGRDPSPDG